MYLMIIFFPLFGALISGFLGRFLGRYGANILTFLCVTCSFILSILALYEVGFLGTTCSLLLSN